LLVENGSLTATLNDFQCSVNVANLQYCCKLTAIVLPADYPIYIGHSCSYRLVWQNIL